MNITVGEAYVNDVGHPPAAGAGGVTKYNASDNLQFFTRIDDASLPNALARMRAFMGDYNNNGRIDSSPPAPAPGEQARATKSYLLWAAGPDGLYGPTEATQTAVSKCDDVANFVQ